MLKGYTGGTIVPEFLRLITPDEALDRLDSHLKTLVSTESIAVSDALERIVATDIRAPENLPSFTRSTMDGYAVRAGDTYGASEGLPVYLRVIGEMPMGRSSSITVHKGEAVKVHTGGMLANGADAVIMVENTQKVDDVTIEVARPLAPGENIIRVGDDIKADEVLFSNGHILRAQDIGGLMALGITKTKVFLRPKVSIISAGDEVVSPEQVPSPGQVRDVNTYTISSLVRKAGAIPIPHGIIPDDAGELTKSARAGIAEAEILVISSGSSISTRDVTAGVISSLGKPGVLVHGVSLRPGKPTILAVVEGKPVFGLPGNPVSAMVVFDLFVRPAIYRVGGCTQAPELPTIMARLTHNIPSTTGREDYVPVKLEFEKGEYRASPIFGESNLITTIIRADGIAKISLDKHGLTAGEIVSVRLF
jgi:molybdopterin molybdotransferase